MLRSLITEALGFLDNIFGTFSWWIHVKEAVYIVVVLIEATVEGSELKKKEAIDLVIKYFADRGISLPMWEWLFRLVLGVLIDIVIGYINDKVGKDWIKTVAEEEWKTLSMAAIKPEVKAEVTPK